MKFKKIEMQQNSQMNSEPDQEQIDATENIENLLSKKYFVQYEWVFINKIDNIENFIKLNKYKTTCSHGKIVRYCSIHDNLNDHKMIVSYYKYSSSLCMRDDDDAVCMIER